MLRISTEKDKAVLKKQKSILKQEINELVKQFEQVVNKSNPDFEMKNLYYNEEIINKLISDLHTNFTEKTQLETTAFELNFFMQENNKTINRLTSENYNSKNFEQIQDLIKQNEANKKMLDQLKNYIKKNEDQANFFINIFKQLQNFITCKDINNELNTKRNMLDKIESQIKIIKLNAKISKLENEVTDLKGQIKEKNETKEYFEKVFSVLLNNSNNNKNNNFPSNLTINQNKLNQAEIKNYEKIKNSLNPFPNNTHNSKNDVKGSLFSHNSNNSELNKNLKNSHNSRVIEYSTPVRTNSSKKSKFKDSPNNLVHDYSSSPDQNLNDIHRINQLNKNLLTPPCFESLVQMNENNDRNLNLIITPDCNNLSEAENNFYKDNLNRNIKLKNSLENIGILSIDDFKVNDNNDD